MIISFSFSSLHFAAITHVLKTSSNDPKERKKYVQLVESVRQKGAEVLIFSSMHESGQREFASIQRGSHVSPLFVFPAIHNLLHLSVYFGQSIAFSSSLHTLHLYTPTTHC